MRRSDFSYELPPDRIAHHPSARREDAKLLVCSRSDPARLEHRTIRDLPELLGAQDMLVVNETMVLPHRLIGRRASGGRVECLILERDGLEAVGFMRPSKRLKVGERLGFEEGALEVELVEARERGRWRFRFCSGTEGEVDAAIERVGRAPLPPYLERDPDSENVRGDRERYQTVFAKNAGAVAAPTAGLHLTDDLLERLRAKGVGRVAVTLHVGEGTFEPLQAEEVEEHSMHEERYVLEPGVARALTEHRAAAGRVICVGTTSARVLETCWDGSELVHGVGSTQLYLYPGRGPRFLDGLLTNFHLPESTLLLLVASILGRARTLELYELALRERYRFFSFGDAMLILP